MPEAEVFKLAGEPALQLRRLAAAGPPVLYVHGATFPAALSVGYRFADGISWEDSLQAVGFDVWSFDFAGFGGSQRFEASASLSESRALAAWRQIDRVVHHIRERWSGMPVNIIAHSWGSIAAGCFLAQQSHSVDRLVFFGPIAERQAVERGEPETLPTSRLITVDAQLKRFVQDVPDAEEPVLAEPDLARWGPAYLDSDPAAHSREPRAVEVPGGPAADILAAWQGSLAYDPAKMDVPTLVIRGEWDSLCAAEDASFLLDRIRCNVKHDIVIPKATHLMHLESGRFRLWKATAAFLQHDDPARALTSTT